MNSQQAISLVQQLVDMKKHELTKQHGKDKEEYRKAKVKKIKRNPEIRRALKDVDRAEKKVRKEIGKIVPIACTRSGCSGGVSLQNYYDTYNDSFFGRINRDYNRKCRKIDNLVTNTKMDLLTKSAREIHLDAFVRALKRI